MYEQLITCTTVHKYTAGYGIMEVEWKSRTVNGKATAKVEKEKEKG